MSKSITFIILNNIEGFFHGILKLLKLASEYISLGVKFVFGFVLEFANFLLYFVEYIFRLTLPIIGAFLLWQSYQVLQVMTLDGIECVGENVNLMIFFLCCTVIGIHTLKFGLAKINLSKFPKIRWY